MKSPSLLLVFFFSISLLCALAGCAELGQVTTLDQAGDGGWRTKSGIPPYGACMFDQPVFEIEVNSLGVTINPDYFPMLVYAGGPFYFPVIPNPFLLALPFISKRSDYAVVVRFTAPAVSDSASTAEASRWTLRPSEATFSFVEGAMTRPYSIVVGQDDPRGLGYRYIQGGQYRFDADSAAESYRLSRARCVQYTFNVKAERVGSIVVFDLGLFKDGVKVATPPLKLVRHDRLEYHTMEFD